MPAKVLEQKSIFKQQLKNVGRSKWALVVERPFFKEFLFLFVFIVLIKRILKVTHLCFIYLFIVFIGPFSLFKAQICAYP